MLANLVEEAGKMGGYVLECCVTRPWRRGNSANFFLIMATAARQARKSFLRFNLSTMFHLRVVVIVAPLALPPFDLSRWYRITHEDHAVWARCPAP